MALKSLDNFSGDRDVIECGFAPSQICADGKVEACGDESSGARGKMDFQEFPTNSIFPLNQFGL